MTSTHVYKTHAAVQIVVHIPNRLIMQTMFYKLV